MKLPLSLLLLSVWFQPAQAFANTDRTDPYAIPPSKVNIEICQREALKLHPGMIDKIRILHRPTTFWTRYEIIVHGGAEWSVICDLSDGRIIRDQNLDSDIPNVTDGK